MFPDPDGIEFDWWPPAQKGTLAALSSMCLVGAALLAAIAFAAELLAYAIDLIVFVMRTIA